MFRVLARVAAVALLSAAAACDWGKDGTAPPNHFIRISVSTAQLTVPCGSSVTATVTLTRGGGYTGAVTISVAGLPDDVTAALAPSELTGTATTTTVTIDASATTVTGQYTLTVTASSSLGDVTATSLLRIVEPPDFALNASPTELTVVRPGGDVSAITIVRTGGFATAVSLSADNVPAGITVSFSPVAVTGNVSAATIWATSSAPLGSHPITIVGTAPGFGTRTAQVVVTVEKASASDFTITAVPNDMRVSTPGAVATIININRPEGFSAPVTISVDGAPAGVSVSFNPEVVTGNATIATIVVAEDVDIGSKVLTFAGVSAGLGTRTTQVDVYVEPIEEFTLMANPSALTIPRGGTGTSTIAINWIGGPGVPIDLRVPGAPSGITCTFDPPWGNMSASALTISVAATVPPGLYALQVGGVPVVWGWGYTTSLIVTVVDPPGP